MFNSDLDSIQVNEVSVTDIQHEDVSEKLISNDDIIVKLSDEINKWKNKYEIAEKTIKRLKSCADIDRRAQHGQLKKARVLEHNNFVQNRLREDAEANAKKFLSSLQRERAQRLRDMHERQHLVAAKKKAEEYVQERSNELKLYCDLSKTAIQQVKGLECSIKSHQSILQENDIELKEQDRDLENLELKNSRLKMKLAEVLEESRHHENIRMRLEKECNRLRTELMRVNTNYKSKSRKGNTHKIQEEESNQSVTHVVYDIPSLGVEKFLGRSPTAKTKSIFQAYTNQLNRVEQKHYESSEKVSLVQLANWMRKATTTTNGFDNSSKCFNI